jgi:hypothetical protein
MRIASLAAGIVLCGCGVAAGQDADLIQNVASRQTTTLSAAWQAIVGPYEAGDLRLPLPAASRRGDGRVLGSGCPRLHSSATKPRKPPDLHS